MSDEHSVHSGGHPATAHDQGEVRLSTSWWSRRTRFQLTPLMDLLLIIVFAQFLEVRETAQQQSQTLQQEREKLTQQITRERSELAGIREAMQTQRRQLEQQRDQARASRDAALQQTDVQLTEVQTAMELIGDWFKLDEAAITRVESETKPPEDPIEKAIARARQLSEARPDAVIRFLIGHAELLKRAEIWTVHATDTGSVEIMAGEQRESFRLEAKTQTARTSEVADRLFAAYKHFPQPKGLVILLISFHPQSVAGVYQPLIDAVPKTLERLRADTPETRFEYTVLGPTLDPT